MRASLKSVVITQAIAIVCFVVLPIVITLVVPFSTLELRRADDGIAATVTRYVLVFVPWRTQQIARVTQLRADISPEVHRQLTAEDRRKGRANVIHATGQVAIIGDGPHVIVQVAPELARDVAARFERFRRDAVADSEMIEVYASWSLSYLLGGTVTALCALYVVGAALAIVTVPFKRRRAA